MSRINRAGAAALWAGSALLAAGAPALAARTVQGGVLLDGVPPSTRRSPPQCRATPRRAKHACSTGKAMARC